MTVPIGSWIQATASFYPVSSGVHQNTFHFLLEGTAPPADALVLLAVKAALTAFYSPFETQWQPAMVNPLVMVDIIDWNAIEAAWRIQYHLGDLVLDDLLGTAAEHALPAGTSLLLNFIPIYRNHTGKKYVGGFTETQNDADGTPSTVLMAYGIDAIDALLAVDFVVETGVSTLHNVILDRTLGEFHYEPIAGVIRNNWSYQRRRKSGVGA